MKQTPSISFFSQAERMSGPDRLASFGRQAVASALMVFLVPLSIGDVYAQDAPPPPPPDYGAQGGAYQPLPPEDLNRLVAPIALYPDSLVAQTLAASTYPAQVASAEQFVRENGGAPPEQLAQMADGQPWDPSVKALTAFPQVLANLNQNMQWTTQLGNAYYNQPQDVMSAVQTMRQRAYDAGNLRRNQQLNVVYSPGAIVIEPINPTVVYVPYYNPWVVYGSPLPPWGYYHYYGPPSGVVLGAGIAIGFGVGIAIGAFTHFGWGYHNWAPNWGARTVVFNHNTYISNSVTVVNHGNYGGFDRNPQARAFNHGEAVRFANVNHTTINNVTVNRTNVTNNTNINRNNGNTYNNNRNFNGSTARTPGNGQAGQFNNGGRPGGAQPGQLNAGARPGGYGQQSGQFNNGARPGGAQPGQMNNAGARPGQFNNAARPGGGAQPGQFSAGARPSAAQPSFQRGGQPAQASRGGGQAHPAPQQHGGGGERGGEHGGGEHHH